MEKQSKEEIVLTEIKKANDLDNPIWFTKIVENLNGVLSRSEVGRAIDQLSDFGYIKGGYGEVRKGLSGYKYHITDIGEWLCHLDNLDTADPANVSKNTRMNPGA